MKVLATSDLHGKLDGLKDYLIDVDIACIAGDVGPLNGFSIDEVYKQLQWIKDNMSSLGKEFPKTEFVFIPGNHDLFAIGKERFHTIQSTYFKNKRVSWKVNLPKNVHMLIDSEITVKGIRIYGTPWVPIIGYRWAFEAEGFKIKEMFNKIPKDVDILLTHTPPHFSYDCDIDRSLDYGNNGQSFGSVFLKDAIEKKSPRYLFCGHIHSGDHSVVHYGRTSCYNVSRLNEQYNITYKPLILDFNL